jgi:cold shock CspA family protein
MNQPQQPPPQKPKSFMEIQAEQEREKQRNTNHPHSHSKSSSTPTTTTTTAATPTGNRRHHTNHQQQQQILTYPIEQGKVCTLKESFGFIECAQRPEQVFFHFSQVLGHVPEQIDTEVEFRIGKSSSTNSNNKYAAYQVQVLPPGTVVWEIPAYNNRRVRGIVETRPKPSSNRNSSSSDNNNNNNNHNNYTDGTIRLLLEKEDGTSAATEDCPLIRFRANPENNHTNNNKTTTKSKSSFHHNKKSTTYSSWNIGDLVECRVVTERRTQTMYARDMVLLLSERERMQQETERQLLETATVEHGVVTALKGEYGFLRSSARREIVYFHYSSIDLEESNSSDPNPPPNASSSEQKSRSSGGEPLVLEEGQDMKFLVVEEGGNGKQPRRLSARRVSLQPRGSVKFYDVVRRGITGTVIQTPQCVDASHELEKHGKIRLDHPFTTKNHTPGEHHGDDEFMTITEVFLSPQDSPGGKFSFRGGTSVGLWIQVGDTLLFDIVQDLADGACRAVPTKYLTPPPPPDNDDENTDENGALVEESDVVPAVRLIQVTLAGRAEGVIGAVKEAYGFIHFAERPVDIHFKLYQMLPDQLQEDLRRNMGFASVDENGQPLRLEIGAHVQFDISVHGTIHSHHIGKKHDHERENLKAQRVLLLPPNTVGQFQVIAKGVRGKICKQEAMQPYVGNVELDDPVEQMTMEEKHPLIAKMIHMYLEKVNSATGPIPPLLFHDIQSLKEDDTVIKMLESLGRGQLTYSYIPQPGETHYPGRLCITKAGEKCMECGDEEENNDKESHETLSVDTLSDVGKDVAVSEDGIVADDDAEGKALAKKRKSNKQKAVKSVRFDKHSLSDELKNDYPPGLDDIVECDVVQCRRTGQSHIENMRIIERHRVEPTPSDIVFMGIVKDVVTARNFGFISVVDESASTNEALFFNFKAANEKGSEGAKKKKAAFRKGDVVQFNIVTENNGKRVATNVTLLPKDALSGKPDKNACRGIVLLQPASTSLSSRMKKSASTISQQSNKSAHSSRWDGVDDDRKASENEETSSGLGYVLLTEDPTGLMTGGSKGKSSEEEKQLKIPPHLQYKLGAVAVIGPGSASVGDETTFPRRGDLVSFVEGRSPNTIRDIRIVSRSFAPLVSGRLENINFEASNGLSANGRATFVLGGEEEKCFEVDLGRVVSCDPSMLKEKDAVEGILYQNEIYGLARSVDLYLETKMTGGKKERPKLNLTVKKDRGGTIMAQSMMARGPDGTNGFAPGWTTRGSLFSASSIGNRKSAHAEGKESSFLFGETAEQAADVSH